MNKKLRKVYVFLAALVLGCFFWGGTKQISAATSSTVYDGVDYSAVYNYNYYISKYYDLRKAFGYDRNAAIEHFVNHGMNEGRQAKASFNVYSYKNRYKDLRTALGNDLKAYYIHYINYGKSENRIAFGNVTITDGVTVHNGVDYSNVYDYSYFIMNHPDVADAYPNDDISVLAHFVNYGMSEGRQAKADFNVYSYKNRYEDLRATFGEDLSSYYIHYINHGKSEGRVAIGYVTEMDGVDYSSVYDYSYYIKNYPDVAAAFPNDDIAVLNHFINHGMNEGRQAKEDFNVQIYKNRYLDLRNAFGDDLKSYYIHYINYGLSEGRTAY